jgi:hypothetical protein
LINKEFSKQSGNPVPYFEEVTNSVLVTIPFKEPIRTTPIALSPSIKLTERQKLILDMLKNGPLNRKSIKEQLEDNPEDRVVQRDLLTLKNLGLIIQKGGSKNIIWTLHHSKY